MGSVKTTLLKEDCEMRNCCSVGRVLLFMLLALTVVSVACRHAPPPAPIAAAPPAPAPPPPAQPTVTLQANPPVVQRGQSSTLNWSSTNATALNLTPNLGGVAPAGMMSVSPAASTTYTITASGPGGTATATALVTVTPPPPPAPAAAQPTIEELFTREVQDAYFDYDKADIRTDTRDALSKTAQFLRSYPQIKVTLEGHCDERGSTEYNIALGDRRAQAAKDFVVSLGVAADRIQTVSYGKERPFCTAHDENCWKQNRRGHFVMAR
jgi:peptidoglycan-associated lipoprotein